MRVSGHLFVLGLLFALTACSSHKREAGDAAQGEQLPPITDAGTDGVPEPRLEGSATASAGASSSDTSGDGTHHSQAPSDSPGSDLNSSDPFGTNLASGDSTPTPKVDETLNQLEMGSGAAVASSEGEASGSDSTDDPNLSDPEIPAGDAKPHRRARASMPSAPALAPVALSGNYEQYSVQAGDTLMKISFETYGDLFRWRSIFQANQDVIKDPSHLVAGTSLKLEKPASTVAIERNGEKYKIKPGQTLGTIAWDIYGKQSNWKKLWENNKQLIHDPNRIFAGFYLYYAITPEEKQEADRLKQSGPPPTIAPGTIATRTKHGARKRAPSSRRSAASEPSYDSSGSGGEVARPSSADQLAN